MALHVTEAACAVLKHLLESSGTPRGQVVRLVMDSQGNVDFEMDTEREDDQIVAHDGYPVMALEPHISEGLSGITLDVKETDNGYALTLSLNSE